MDGSLAQASPSPPISSSSCLPAHSYALRPPASSPAPASQRAVDGDAVLEVPWPDAVGEALAHAPLPDVSNAWQGRETGS